MASWLTAEKTGPITNSVRNSARPINTWFGGTPLRLRALRVRPRTMTMRVKLVIRINSAGTIEMSVSSSTIDSGELVAPPLVFLPVLPKLIDTAGLPGVGVGGVVTVGALIVGAAGVFTCARAEFPLV